MLLGGANIGGGGGSGTINSGTSPGIAYYSGATAISSGDIGYGTSATLPYFYRPGEDDEGMIISGGSADNLGGNIILFGEAHATKPGFIELRKSATVIGFWDGTNNRWSLGESGSSASTILNGNDVTFVSSASTTIVTLSRSVNTGAIQLLGGTGTGSATVTCYGSTHATLAGYLAFRLSELRIDSVNSTDIPFVFRNVDDGGIVYSGGQDLGSGFIRMFGETHASTPGRVEIGSTVSGSRILLSTETLRLGHPTATSEFSVVRESTTGSAGYYGGSGSNNAAMILYGSGHATLAQRIYFQGTRMHFFHPTASSQFILMNDSANGSLGIYGGSAATGGTITLFGVSEGTNPAEVQISNTAGIGYRYTSAGRVHLQPAGSSQQMRINGATEAAGSVSLTLGNGPNAIATGTDPDIWAKITYNSDTAYVFPLWALS